MSTVATPIAFTPRRRGGVRFGPQLRKLREDRTETLEQAARGIGIYSSTLLRLERGDRGASHDIAQAIVAYYNVELGTLRSSD